MGGAYSLASFKMRILVLVSHAIIVPLRRHMKTGSRNWWMTMVQRNKLAAIMPKPQSRAVVSGYADMGDSFEVKSGQRKNHSIFPTCMMARRKPLRRLMAR
jgi:hypothetical protein